jgi:hypothetical protein
VLFSSIFFLKEHVGKGAHLVNLVRAPRMAVATRKCACEHVRFLFRRQLMVIVLLSTMHVGLSLTNGLFLGICSPELGANLAAIISNKMVMLFSGITTDVSLFQSFGQTALMNRPLNYISPTDLVHTVNGYANAASTRKVELFYGNRATNDDANIYSPKVDTNRSIATDLIAIQALAPLIPNLVDRRRKTAEQYQSGLVDSIVGAGQVSTIEDGFIITQNDVWYLYPSLPLQNLPSCHGYKSLCMTDPAYLLSNESLADYYVNGTFSDYYGPDLNSTSYEYYSLTTPENNPSRSVQWTSPYAYEYDNLIR